MSKTWETLQTAFVDEEEDEIKLSFKNEVDIIKYYNKCTTDKEFNALYEFVDNYNIDQKIDEYREKIYDVYKFGFEEFMKHEAPTHIFDTGLHNNMMVNFIKCVYNNSSKGRELEYVLSIQHEYDKKLEIEEKKLEDFRKKILNT